MRPQPKHRHRKAPVAGANAITASKASKQKQLAADWEALQAKWSPMRAMPSFSQTTVPSYATALAQRRRGTLHTAKSLSVFTPQAKAPIAPALTPELQEREKAAQAIAEKRKQQVAPVANKMGYQLITDPADFKTMGRKT